MRCIVIELLALFIFIPDMAFCGAKPRPPAYLDWTKPGATVLDVKKIFLECGWPSSDPGNEEIEQAGMTINDQALAELCMMRNGFVCRDKTWCYYNPSLPACQPGAVIPTPSVERRLKSWWCTQKIERHNGGYEGCLKTALYPEKCSTDDFSIPPECLP
jgi:hypothetical protein